MNRDLHVHVDTASGTIPVGRLWLREKNGRQSSSFKYDAGWLKSPRGYALAPSLQLGEGAFHFEDGLFGAFSDSAPDRWGQKLMRHRERDRAREAGTKPGALLAGDFLVGVDDATRIGALRFKDAGGGAFLSQAKTPVPPLLELKKLLSATERLERGRARKGDLELVLAPGGSLGGARPKATVHDRNQRLHVAKFPWVQDEWSVILWELSALELGASAGISVPDWSAIKVRGSTVLLVARFDRGATGRRIPFMSAMTALGAKDHEDHSYLELVDAIRQMGEEPEQDCRQLWRRMVFNVLISNTDDHLRNHAFLRGERGWRLSPAYDVNPTPADISGGVHVLALNEVDRAGSLEIAMSVAEYFGLKLFEARAIAGEVAAAVAGWKAVAERFGVDGHEIERVSSAFRQEDLDLALSLRETVPIKPVRRAGKLAVGGQASLAQTRSKAKPRPASKRAAARRRVAR